MLTAAVVTAGVTSLAVLVVMVVTVNIGIVAQTSVEQCAHRRISVPADTAVELDARLGQCCLRTAADALCGTHDFTSFTSDKTPGKSHVRRIDSITVDTVTLPSGIELLRFTFCGNGFLYNMVRILSGTLLSVGLGQIPAAQIPAIIEGKSRPLAGPTLPPCGLFLTDVTYP